MSAPELIQYCFVPFLFAGNLAVGHLVLRRRHLTQRCLFTEEAKAESRSTLRQPEARENRGTKHLVFCSPTFSLFCAMLKCFGASACWDTRK